MTLGERRLEAPPRFVVAPPATRRTVVVLWTALAVLLGAALTLGLVLVLA